MAENFAPIFSKPLPKLPDYDDFDLREEEDYINNNSITYRMAIDARIVNEKTTLMDSYIPTSQDMDTHYSIPGPMTIFDVKGAFDGVPAHPDDKKFLDVTMPQGRRRMDHITYGFMNVAPWFQNFMNKLSIKIKNTLIYIDDGSQKHQPFETATINDYKNDLTRLFEIMKEYNVFEFILLIL